AADDVQFMIEPVCGFGGRVGPVAIAQPLLAKLAQIRLGSLVRRRSENREMPRLEIQLDATAIGNLLTALDSLGMTREESIHLLRTAHVELVAAVTQAILVVASLAGVDAQQYVVSGTIPLAQVVGIAGSDQR